MVGFAPRNRATLAVVVGFAGGFGERPDERRYQYLRDGAESAVVAATHEDPGLKPTCRRGR
jgi:hypothetical protein